MLFIGDSKPESVGRENNSSQSALQKEMEELKKNTDLYFKRFKKEKRVRRRLQEQLEIETKRREQVKKGIFFGTVVVAQLVERSLLIPEVHGSNPVIGKNLY